MLEMLVNGRMGEMKTGGVHYHSVFCPALLWYIVKSVAIKGEQDAVLDVVDKLGEGCRTKCSV